MQAHLCPSWIDSDSILTELSVQGQECLRWLFWAQLACEPLTFSPNSGEITSLWREKRICLSCLLMAVSTPVNKTRFTSHRESKLVSMAPGWARVQSAAPKGPVCLGTHRQSACPGHVRLAQPLQAACEEAALGEGTGDTCVLCSQPAASHCHPRRDGTMDFRSTARWNPWKALVSSTQLGLVSIWGRGGVVLDCCGGTWEKNKLIGDGQRVWLYLLQYNGAGTRVTVRSLLPFIVNEYAVPSLHGCSEWILQKKRKAVCDFCDLGSTANVSVYNRQ